MPRPLSAALLVIPALLFGATAAAPPQSGADLLRSWLAGVEDHRAGEADDWARAIGDWSKPQLVSLLHAVDTGDVGARPRKRGAVLHLDIAFRVTARATGNLLRVYPRNSPTPPLVTAEVVDGRHEGTGASLTHLEVARALLARLPSEALRDEFVRLWYDAAAARLASQANFAELTLHLEHARRLFPDDADILLASGCLHEVFAAPRSQAAVRTGGGARLALGSERSNLSQAESYFRRAVGANPDRAEARLRLGRVLDVQGRHKEAEAELRRVVETPADPTQLYYGLLFLGRAQESQQRLDDARRAFELAATLLPHAQSPRLALSRLALERGDHREAEKALEPAFAVSAGSGDGFDPWWTYFTGQGRFADEKLLRLYKALAREPR